MKPYRFLDLLFLDLFLKHNILLLFKLMSKLLILLEQQLDCFYKFLLIWVNSCFLVLNTQLNLAKGSDFIWPFLAAFLRLSICRVTKLT
jgi:hypothetical protein